MAKDESPSVAAKRLAEKQRKAAVGEIQISATTSQITASIIDTLSDYRDKVQKDRTTGGRKRGEEKSRTAEKRDAEILAEFDRIQGKNPKLSRSQISGMLSSGRTGELWPETTVRKALRKALGPARTPKRKPAAS